MKTAVRYFRTSLMHPHEARMTKCLHMQTRTLMHRWSAWEFDGKHPRPSPSRRSSPTWASSGTLARARCVCSKRKDSNTQQ
jgi:hypothetical protein